MNLRRWLPLAFVAVAAACATTGVAVAAVLPPTGESAIESLPQSQELSISAQNIAFSVASLTATEGDAVTVHFSNNDAALPHSFGVYTDSGASQALAPGSVGSMCTGPCSSDISFTAPAAGTYFFRCDVHPAQMTGQFIVEAVAQQPAATATQPGGEPAATDAAPTQASGGAQPTAVAGVPAAGTGPGDSGFEWWPVLLAASGAALLASGWLLWRRSWP